MSNLRVSSEIGRLRKVMVHQPDSGIGRITPKRADELLFDDIVHLPQMRSEHSIFVDVLNTLIGKENVLEVETLIREALDHSPEGKENLINMITEFEEIPSTFVKELWELENASLAHTLICGYCKETDTILFDPIPNFIFTRDIAVMVNDHVIITKAAKEARHRENLLTRFMLWRHPLFANMKEQGNIINLNLLEEFPPNRKGERVSAEGGDIMILNKDYLLIGVSERSTEHAFNSIKNALFERSAIDNVVMIRIPNDRSYMHIDTVFTQVNHTHMLAYKPIVSDGLSSYVEVHNRKGLKRDYPSIREFLKAEIHPNMELIFSGMGKTPYQEREQWTDACNLLTVKPGVAISYDRNIYTEQALRDVGYTVIPALEFLAKAKADSNYADTVENTIISLPSGELSRARGGSHCMSCPIMRD
jgi:arginine deiminase